jgi:hypothetical protein
MTSSSFTRFGTALALATVVAALVIPAVASARATGAMPDAFERYAAAHPYGQIVVRTIDGRSADTLDAAPNEQAGANSPTPDAFERYAAAHPYGQIVVRTIDGRSADTLDAVHDATQASLIPGDGRSPDTLEAASAPRPVVFTQQGGFHWGDAGIGAGFAGGLLLLVAVVGTWWLRHQSRRRIQTT